MSSASTQLVRDLLWVVNSASFCEGENLAPPMPLDPRDIDQAALRDFMVGRSEHRVGRYFEHLLLFWLTHVRKVEMVGSGIQIRDGKRTVGEIDYLYRDEQDRFTHCEASVKFFLHHPRPDTSDFPGPNATDNYERKITKLFEQQLELSREHYPDVVQRHAFVKGIVFYRGDVAAPPQLPDRLPENHLRGRWLRESELDILSVTGAQQGAIADKPFWLAPVSVRQAVPLPKLKTILAAHFADRAHPVMVSTFNLDGTEAERLFVVPDQWPARRQQTALQREGSL